MFFTAISFQAKHATTGNGSWGVDGENGNIVDMHTYGVWEPYSVKAQTYKTAIEVREREGERVFKDPIFIVQRLCRLFS